MSFAMRIATVSIIFVLCTACMAPPKKPDSAAMFAAGIGERVRAGRVYVTPLSVLEDSRCPADVQCIQAGTVRITVRLERGGAENVVPVGLEKPHDMGDGWLHLVAACPYPRHAPSPAKGERRFTFAIEKAATTPPRQVACDSR